MVLPKVKSLSVRDIDQSQFVMTSHCCLSLLGLPEQSATNWMASAEAVPCFQVLEAGSGRSRCGQGSVPSETCRGRSFLVSSGFRLPWAVLGPGSRIPVSFSSSLGVLLVSLHIFPLCVSVFLSKFPFLQGPGHIGLAPTLMISF